MVQQLADSHPGSFAPMTMHVNGDAYSLSWGQNRLDVVYGLHGAAPSFMVDGMVNSELGYYIDDVEQRMGKPTDVTLELTGDPVGGSTWDVSATVCLQGTGNRPVRVVFAPTLNHHPDLPSYATNVLMQTPLETDTTLIDDDCTTVTNSITFDALSMANSSNIVVVAWVHDPGLTNVHQAGVMRWPFPSGTRLTTIDVMPGDVTVNVGDQVDYTATGRDQHDADYPLTAPSWSLGMGTGAGAFAPTAGTTTTFTATAPGIRQVICTEAGVSGKAVITIREAPQLAVIEIDPATATIEVDGEISFSASGLDQYGEPFELTVPAWTVSGVGDGNFDPTTGTETTFTASYPGVATVTCTEGGVSGTAAVEITGANPTLTTITVDPVTAQLSVGSELDLEAIGIDQYGRPIEIDFPSWYTDGDGDGTFEPVEAPATTFTATAAGTGRLICAAGGGVEGVASVVITRADLPAPRKATRRVVPQQ